MPTAFTQESDFRQEREFGQKISATFEFIGAHWRPLGRVMLYTVLPAALLYGVVNTTLQLRLWGGSLRPAAATGVASARLQFTNMTQLMGSPLYFGTVLLSIAFFTLVVLSVYGYLLGCLRGPGQAGPGAPAGAAPPVAVAEVWALIRRQFWGTYFSIFGLYFLVAAGFVLLVVPGIYLSVMLSLFFIVKLVEGTGFADTVGRCWQLIKGKWWSTFGLLLVMVLLLYALLFLVGTVASLLGGSVLGLLRPGTVGPSPVFAIVVSTLSTGLILLLYPPLLLVLAFQYFNLVERREGVGLHALVGQLGQAAPPAHNAAYRPDEEGEY